ncbi:lipopolysaccharide biosynthesis protein [Stutzerimonas stutzeri]|uniref:lipopolysaccharide biosynthesis protein n=1 Tax=Stutzerimonas stutzeri TaxID=316 RepID=UPI00210F0EB9|nr:oligosaccharide flippase family protein [Stutzerimonas stutzeri]
MSVIDQSGGAPGFRERLAALLHGSRNSQLLRNILTVVSGAAGAQALTLAFMPVITRIYGPEAYGVLGTFLSVTLMLIPVAALTYPIAIVLPRRDGDARGLVRLSLLIALGMAALVALLLYLFGDALTTRLQIQILQPYLLLVPLVMFSGAALEICQQWLFRTQRFRITASVAVGHSLLFNSIRTLAGLVQSSALVLVCSTALQHALHAAMLGLAMLRAKPHIDNHDGDQSKQSGESVEQEPGLLTLARRHSDFPIFRAPVMLINAVSQQLPTLILAVYFGPAAAGFFALCRQAMSMPTNLIGKSVADVYYPRISRAIHDGEPVAAMLIKATAALALVGLVPFSLVVAFGPWLFALVFGEQWQVAGEFARWLALAEYLVFVSRPCVVAVPALSLQRRFLVFEIFSTSLRVLALFGGAVLIGDALATVQAFAAAGVVIYLTLMVMVIFQARRWYVQQRATA